MKLVDMLAAIHPRRHPGRSAAVLAGVGLAIFFTWLFWPVNFKILIDHNPDHTRLMEIRQAQARRQGQSYRIRYRWVPLRRIAEPLRKAVIAAEDDVFYRHRGLDYNAIRISLKNNWKRKAYAQGGSTITQQVVKNLYLSPKKSLLRKMREAVLALQIERALSKPRIFEIYLNIAEWGRGIFGAEAAARNYFGKSAAELTLDEAVALVAVLPSPLKHAPVREDRFLNWRKKWIMRQLRSTGYLPKEEVPEVVEEVPAWMLQETAEADDPQVLLESQGNSESAAVYGPAAMVTPAAEPEVGESSVMEETESEPTPTESDEDDATPLLSDPETKNE